MIGLDTNILIRLTIDDVPEQSLIARRLVRNNVSFISKTVLLETEWVLRSAYKIDRIAISEFFSMLLESENTVIEDHEIVERALHWHVEGADFADALHLSSCGTSVFHTFDKSFCKTIRNKKLAPSIKVHQSA
jgi:predicted nucleic-acid-binding protein